ncbi:MAG: tail fiber protein [Phaeodactylibacter sp.]|uniref:phage tail protein n=1 Tax=Phaeodactylibacter sp. TaxID=1940289 RepID=UPI0032ECDDBD
MKYLIYSSSFPRLAFHFKALFFSAFLMVFFIQSVTAQAPEQFSYQGVVRDLSNNLITNTTLGVRITIRQGSPAGNNVFRETHNPVTNGAGLFSIEIGTGTIENGSISAINWQMGPYYIEQEIDPNGGVNYTITGTTQLLSVPYSLYAKNAGRAATADVADQASSLSASGAATLTVPLGTILPYAGSGSSVPDGWLLCDGTSYDDDAYPDLFTLIGYTYGSESGRFRVPNLNGRVPVGLDNNQAEFNALGNIGGNNEHTLTVDQIPAHSHSASTGNDGAHTHDVVTEPVPGVFGPYSVLWGDGGGNGINYIDAAGGAGSGQINSGANVFASSAGTHNHPVTVNNTGGGQAHSILQPYLTINYMIKAR